MTVIRTFQPDDSISTGILIADTYSRFNLSTLPPEERALFLGPFRFARSSSVKHREGIAGIISAAMVYVAEDEGEIIGILRGRNDKLQSLFVREDHHRQGVGRSLVNRFEAECIQQNSECIKVQATLYAVPFYLAMGYKRTTGIRKMCSFEGRGLEYQPMKKVMHSK